NSTHMAIGQSVRDIVVTHGKLLGADRERGQQKQHDWQTLRQNCRNDGPNCRLMQTTSLHNPASGIIPAVGRISERLCGGGMKQAYVRYSERLRRWLGP